MDTLRMKKLIVVAAVVLMLMMVLPRGGSALEVSMSPLAECTPDCTGMANGDQVADPQNCTNYYYCINGEPADHPNSCPSGHFDPNEHTCVPEEECTPVCGPGGTGCAITCNASTVMVANPFNCSTYYLCTAGDPVLRYCTPDFPYFDGRGCTYDPSVCCPPYCGAYCDSSSEFVMVPDPEDCKSFYVCNGEEGPPTDDFHYPCNDGQYFNIALGNCVTADDGFSCTNLCDAASDTTTTTSTTTTSSGGGGGSSNGPTDGGGTTTTTTTTTTGDCVSSFTCPAVGFFPACQTCQPEYFNCDGAGVAGVLDTCSDGQVFNPTPGHGFCLLPSNCPFP